jgi:hypothetical protein
VIAPASAPYAIGTRPRVDDVGTPAAADVVGSFTSVGEVESGVPMHEIVAALAVQEPVHGTVEQRVVSNATLERRDPGQGAAVDEIFATTRDNQNEQIRGGLAQRATRAELVASRAGRDRYTVVQPYLPGPRLDEPNVVSLPSRIAHFDAVALGADRDALHATAHRLVTHRNDHRGSGARHHEAGRNRQSGDQPQPPSREPTGEPHGRPPG